MRLAWQIAAGIFIAGIASWFFWLFVLAAVVSSTPSVIPQVTVDLSHVFPSLPVHGAALSSPAALPVMTVSVPAESCRNFVQMQGGQRHCLEQQLPGRR